MIKTDLKRTPRAAQMCCDWEKAPVELSIAEKKVRSPAPKKEKALFVLSLSLI